MPSKSSSTYRRNRKLQGGGDSKNRYTTRVVNSHTRPVSTPQTKRKIDVPSDYVRHPQ